ncbi:MAG: DUF6677 family protein [Planctomycetota bacterium]
MPVRRSTTSPWGGCPWVGSLCLFMWPRSRRGKAGSPLRSHYTLAGPSGRLSTMHEEPEERPLQPLSALLGWVLPGLGHMRNGEMRRGWLVMLGVLGMFLLGVLVGGVDCVSRMTPPSKGGRSLVYWFLAQAGCGPIAFAADAADEFLIRSGRVGEMHQTMQPDGSIREVNSFTPVGGVADVGTLFTSMAGLMNGVAVLDALRGRRRDG